MRTGAAFVTPPVPHGAVDPDGSPEQATGLQDGARLGQASLRPSGGSRYDGAHPPNAGNHRGVSLSPK